jgi:DNA mismatch endonuclease (patch repair protein)
VSQLKRFQRPYRKHDPAVMSALMSRIRGQGNVAERMLRRALWSLGYRYRLQDQSLPGRPDLVFRASRVVVFVDGDFWHGRILIELGRRALRATFRGDRREWWVEKITRNARRDEVVTRKLRDEGWLVVRVWESDVKLAPERVARQVAALIRRRVRGRRELC